MTSTLDGRVVVVTGGGRGIGREHALLLASEGAAVVVNDLGGSNDGVGADMSASSGVAREIIEMGGRAVANGDDVSSWDGAQRMIRAAVDAFGDLHGVVNNAGILRDRMLVSMSESDFDAVIAVHLKGTFNVTRWAAEFWRERAKQGDAVDRSIVNTASGAGLHGNPGQTNYAAAKAGIAAMTIVNALELKRYGVRANCIAPLARTRLTLDSDVADIFRDDAFDPKNVSPLVACLLADRCPFNGQVFSVFGGSVGIYQGWSIAEQVTADGRWGVDNLREAMESLPRKVKAYTQLHALAEVTRP